MVTIPSGTVTFLFTDIEGSTQLLQRFGDRYPDLLAQHEIILRSALTKHGGYEVVTEGDSFFIAFSRAADGIAAAVCAQEELTRHAWPESGLLSVRMGLHTGEPTCTGEDYTGL